MPVSPASDSCVLRNMEAVQAWVCLTLQTELGSPREGLAASDYACPARPGLSKLLPGGEGWHPSIVRQSWESVLYPLSLVTLVNESKSLSHNCSFA